MPPLQKKKAEKNKFERNINLFGSLGTTMQFPTNIDIQSLHRVREWGNLSSHDIFPAVTKAELQEFKPKIVRIIKGILKIAQDNHYNVF